ncbi:hypothetical protein [Cereibacter azotoformans]|uniref:hypothetical protein n=1 Tax=Cereibacter azotoformans TaxID=43057 RepID=UPI000C6E1007|nr:hypothetical protein [Cereibacter azotoformans]
MERAQFFSVIYSIGGIATFVALIVMDFPDFNFWNWLIILPINLFLAGIWPIYWGLLHWVFY